DDAIALETDIDDNILLAEADDAASYDFVGGNMRERCIDKVREDGLTSCLCSGFRISFKLGKRYHPALDLARETSSSGCNRLRCSLGFGRCRFWFRRGGFRDLLYLRRSRVLGCVVGCVLGYVLNCVCVFGRDVNRCDVVLVFGHWLIYGSRLGFRESGETPSRSLLMIFVDLVNVSPSSGSQTDATVKSHRLRCGDDLLYLLVKRQVRCINHKGVVGPSQRRNLTLSVTNVAL